MKVLFSFLAMILLSAPALADEPTAEDTALLRNCFSQSRRAQFFVHKMGVLGLNGETPIMLLNRKKEVVGIVPVKKHVDDRSGKVTMRVTGLELCANLEVNQWYYADGTAEDIRYWDQHDSVDIYQDEGRINIKVSLMEALSYANLYKADFLAYDVLGMDEETEENDGWGPHRGEGTFYFYLPKNLLEGLK